MGGKPSVAALRHRDNFLTAELKARYHAFLSKAVPELMLPSVEAEAQDPQAADRTYEAANDWLLAQTRDQKQFPLVFEENVNYGFRRNFWAMKPLALTISGLSLAASLAAIWWAWASNGREPSAETVAASALIALYFVCLTVLVRRDWVHVPATAFARQLLAACDVLPSKKPPSPRKRTQNK